MPDQENQRDYVGSSGVYPASGPMPAGPAVTRGQGALAHPEERRWVPALPAARPLGSTLLMLGRVIFGGYFAYNGINHFVNRSMMAAYAGSKGVPQPDAAVLGTGALLMAGGIGLVLGTRPKLSAAMITTFLASVSPVMHDFWNVEDPGQRQIELVNFSKNIALIGGACLAAAMPEPWPGSVRI